MTFHSTLRGLAVGTAALAATTLAAPQAAEANACTGVQVMILADDEGKHTVKGNSELFRRITTELERQMARYGFCMKGQDFLELMIGGELPDRLSRVEKLRAVNDARALGDPRMAPRVVVFAKMVASVQDLGYRRNIKLRMNGDMFNFKASAYSGGWEAPTQTFPVSDHRCTGPCLSEEAGKHGRDVAAVLGDVLRVKLANIVGVSPNAAREGPVEGKDQRVTNHVLFTFRDFSRIELFDLTEAMELEFPHSVKMDILAGDRAVMKVNLVTKATERELFRYMSILLANYYVEGQVKMQLIGGDFNVDKLYDGPPKQANRPTYE